MNKSRPQPNNRLLPRFRVLHKTDIALGPGKVELLQWIQKTGSIAEASKEMGMSYMRAWQLLQTMERCFKEPLVDRLRGGKQGGGAQLTKTGTHALALYEKMESDAARAIEKSWRDLQKLLKR